MGRRVYEPVRGNSPLASKVAALGPVSFRTKRNAHGKVEIRADLFRGGVHYRLIPKNGWTPQPYVRQRIKAIAVVGNIQHGIVVLVDKA